MDHIAIMKKSWGLIPRILTGEKIIESRWYINRAVPWNRIKVGDSVYFKNSGELITVQATVSNVLQFENLTSEKVKEILDEYGSQDGIQENEINHYYELFKNKKYCILVFINDAHEITPFQINKKGFGMQAAWLSTISIKRIKE